MQNNQNNFQVRDAWASVFHVRLVVLVGDRLYEVHVDALDDGYDVEVYDQSFGDAVDVSEFIGRFGFSSLHLFAEALADGFHLDGPEGFYLSNREGVAS